MNDFDDNTLTSSLASEVIKGRPMLGLTVQSHPDRTRIGEQYFVPAGEGEVQIGRFTPLFRKPGGTGLGLGERRVARDPLRIRRTPDDGIEILAPESRMVVEVNGLPVAGHLKLSTQQVDRGIVLGLGGAVVLCVHWMRTFPKMPATDGMLGVSSAVVMMRNAIMQVAGTDLPVLLLGETGTGKEVCAKAIHAASRRRQHPLVSVNMATLNETLAAADLFGAVKGAYTGAQYAREGLFSEAGEGTLFLDEIGNTPQAVQPMLLRTLETGEYRPLGGRGNLISRARLITATDRDLDTEAFSQPLLRRLEAFVIHVPPLRARREDIGLLTLHFLQSWEDQCGQIVEMPVNLITQLCNYDWPGNVRQLANVVRRIAIALLAGEQPELASLVRKGEGAPRPASIPDAFAVDSGHPSRASNAAHSIAQDEQRYESDESEATESTSPRVKLADLSEQDVLDALDKCGWQIKAAALALGISRPSLYRLLEVNPRIRRVEMIPVQEIQDVWRTYGGDLGKCASVLQTPSEALRRYVRAAGLQEPV